MWLRNYFSRDGQSRLVKRQQAELSRVRRVYPGATQIPNNARNRLRH